MVEYKICKTKSKVDPNVFSFGIEVVCDGEVDMTIDDISTDEGYVEMLEELCNRCEVSPIHIKDVVEDFLVK